MKLNGITITLNQSCTITALLTQHHYPVQQVAVELNDKIVPKREFDITFVTDEDTIEVVSFVGGG